MHKITKTNKFHSINTELIIWFLSLSLLPLIIVVGFSYQQAKQSLMEAAHSQLVQSSNSKIRFIQNWFDYRLMDIKRETIDKLSVQLLQEFSQQFSVSHLSLADYVISADWQSSAKKSTNELFEVINSYDYIYDFLLIDKQGNILYTIIDETNLGINLFDKGVESSQFSLGVKNTLQTGKANFTDLVRYATSNNMISGFVTAPVINNEHEIIGVLAMQIRLNRIFDLMESESTDIKHFLLASNGILRTPIHLTPQQQPDFDEVLKEKSNQTTWEFVQQSIKSLDNGSASNTTRSMTYVNQDNILVIGTAHEVNLPGVKWYLVSEIAEEEALQPATWLAKVMLSLVIIVGLLVIMIAIFIARRITQPLSQLADATQSVALGELDLQISLTTKNEIGRLARAFNKMVLKRRLFEHNLKESHKILTHTLAELSEQKYALDQHSIVAVTDIKGIITYVNKKFMTVSGYSKHELIGQNHRIISSNLHDKQFFRQMYLTISKGKVWHGEIRNQTRNGEIYWLDTTIVPFMGDNNKPKSYVAIRTDITKRKIAQQKLVESEQRYSLAMSVANDGIWDWNMLSDNVIFDDRYFTIAGYRSGEFPHKFYEWEKRVHPDDLDLVKQILNQYLNGQILKFEIEFRFLRKDNTYMWLRSKGEFVAYDNDGHPTRMIGTHSDISKQMDASIALKRSEKNLLMAQKTAKIGHYNYLTETSQWSCSVELERIFGIDSQFQKTLNSWFQIIHPDDRKLMANYLQNHVLRDHNLFDIEYRIITQDTNQNKWVHGIGGLIFDDENNPIELIGTIQDITRQKQVELALHKANERRTLLLNTIPHAILENNLDGKITFSNDAHHKLLERSPGEIVGRYIWVSNKNKDDVSQQKKYFAYLIKEQPKPEPYITTSFTKTGKEILLEIIWSYQKDKNEKLIGFISVITDITQRRKSEIVMQRAQKMEAIGQLTGGIAHDFNNILGVIIGNLDLLDSQFKDQPRAIKRIASASKAALRAENLTKQLLSFSRRKVTESKTSDVNHLILAMDDIINHSVGNRVDVCYKYDQNIWLTEIDHGDFQDAMVNLLINARDAVNYNGKVTIQTSNVILDQACCQLNQAAKPGQYVQISISDNGSGISKELQSDIFEPFFTTKPQGKGTGLGLSMVFGFVKRCGGHIEVYSELNIGTTFRIYLPKSLNEVDKLNLIQDEEKAEIPVVGNETILVVDDEPGLLELAKNTLQDHGYNVLTSKNANQAIKILNSEKNINLLFSDVVMPGGVNGFELADLTTKEHPSIKILLTSGFTGKANVDNGLNKNQTMLLAKPYTQKEMVFRIRMLLNEPDLNKSDINKINQKSQDKALEDISNSINYPILWNDSMAIGITSIDQEHCKLIFEINKLHQTMTERKKSNFELALKIFIKNMGIHFDNEEAIMNAYHYPKVKAHIHIHQLLLKQVKHKQQQLLNNLISTYDFMTFLGQWLFDHIIQLDSDIGLECKGKENEMMLTLATFESSHPKESSFEPK